MKLDVCKSPAYRRGFIGGSDARIIIGDDQAALLRLWREKRGELEPEDLFGNLIVQLGVATEALNRHWFETQYRPRLFAFTGLPKTYAQPSPIFGDKFDAGGLNCSLQLRTGFIRNPRAKSAFESLDGREG